MKRSAPPMKAEGIPAPIRSVWKLCRSTNSCHGIAKGRHLTTTGPSKWLALSKWGFA
jgi:hypothetical protein